MWTRSANRRPSRGDPASMKKEVRDGSPRPSQPHVTGAGRGPHGRASVRGTRRKWIVQRQRRSACASRSAPSAVDLPCPRSATDHRKAVHKCPCELDTRPPRPYRRRDAGPRLSPLAERTRTSVRLHFARDGQRVEIRLQPVLGRNADAADDRRRYKNHMSNDIETASSSMCNVIAGASEPVLR